MSPKPCALPIRPLKLQTLLTLTQLQTIDPSQQTLVLYRRFLRLTPFIPQRSFLQKSYKSILKLRFKQDFNERRSWLLESTSELGRFEILTRGLKTLGYVNHILSHTSLDPEHLLFFQNYLRVHWTREDFYKSVERKDPLVRNLFESGEVLDSKRGGGRYGGYDLESYRDFERVVMMFNESEGLCF